jgi:hypothetical protein
MVSPARSPRQNRRTKHRATRQTHFTLPNRIYRRRLSGEPLFGFLRSRAALLDHREDIACSRFAYHSSGGSAELGLMNARSKTIGEFSRHVFIAQRQRKIPGSCTTSINACVIGNQDMIAEALGTARYPQPGSRMSRGVALEIAEGEFAAFTF